MHKFHHGDIIIDTTRAPTLQKPKHNTRYSHDQQYTTETWYRDYRKFSFFLRTAKEFNELPPEAISASVESLQSYF